jgi:hypothetical protein
MTIGTCLIWLSARIGCLPGQEGLFAANLRLAFPQSDLGIQGADQANFVRKSASDGVT